MLLFEAKKLNSNDWEMLSRSLQRPRESWKLQPTSVPTGEFCATIRLLILSLEAFFSLHEEEGIIVSKDTVISCLCVVVGDLEGEGVGGGKVFTKVWTFPAWNKSKKNDWVNHVILLADLGWTQTHSTFFPSILLFNRDGEHFKKVKSTSK